MMKTPDRNDFEELKTGKSWLESKRGMKMLKKIFAAAICGIVIASMSAHADAAGPAGFARDYTNASHSALAEMTDARRDELSRLNTSMDALDEFFTSFVEESKSDGVHGNGARKAAATTRPIAF